MVSTTVVLMPIVVVPVVLALSVLAERRMRDTGGVDPDGVELERGTEPLVVVVVLAAEGNSVAVDRGAE